MKTPTQIAHAVRGGLRGFPSLFGRKREVERGDVLGAYTLEAKLGEGGMGAVWRARHERLARPAALKILPPERMDDVAVRRFEREVQRTALLDHPSAVTIYDYGRTRDGVLFYAMELLDGLDLQRLVDERGPLPPARVVHLLAQICGALAEAHRAGLVHRDVKPSNILIARSRGEHERAKLADFGLVKELGFDSDDVAITATNTITGSPLYMAPEAITTPGAVDARSDLYSLGALAFFLLTGRPPFEGNLIEVCSAHLHAPVPALTGVPEDLAAIVLACLAKAPDARPSSAHVLRDALESCACAADWRVADAHAFWLT